MTEAKMSDNKNFTVDNAHAIAVIAHNGQYRRDGVTPYLTHPQAVASRVRGDSNAEAAAWLHDVLEDTSVTAQQLLHWDVSQEVVDAVQLLTKTADVSYEEYIQRIKNNPIALKVKIADILSNLADQPTDKQIIKYAKALLMLTEP